MRDIIYVCTSRCCRRYAAPVSSPMRACVCARVCPCPALVCLDVASSTDSRLECLLTVTRIPTPDRLNTPHARLNLSWRSVGALTDLCVQKWRQKKTTSLQNGTFNHAGLLLAYICSWDLMDTIVRLYLGFHLSFAAWLEVWIWRDKAHDCSLSLPEGHVTIVTYGILVTAEAAGWAPKPPFFSIPVFAFCLPLSILFIFSALSIRVSDTWARFPFSVSAFQLFALESQARRFSLPQAVVCAWHVLAQLLFFNPLLHVPGCWWHDMPFISA